MAVPRALTRALLCYMLYSRAAEQNNLVCLNEYSTSNVTLGALRKTKIIEKKKNLTLKTQCNQSQQKMASHPLCPQLPDMLQAAELKWQSVQRGVQTGETPLRVHIAQAVTLVMQLVNVGVAVFGTSLRAGAGFLRTLLCLCLFSLLSPAVTFRQFKTSYICRLGALLTQVRTDNWKE